MKKKRLVKEGVKEDFYLYILRQIKSRKMIKHIYQNRDNQISKQRLNWYIQKLKEQNLIKKIGLGTWDLTLKGRQQVKVFSLGVRKKSKRKINLHALNIEVPIISEIKGFKWDNKVNLRNWIAEYKYGLKPIGLTLMKGTKNIQIYVYSREIKDHTEITGLLLRTLMFVKKYLGERGIKIDEFEAKVKTLHLAIKDRELDNIIPKNLALKIDLERDIKKLLKKDEGKKAKAWTDTSPFRGVETNDVEYAENYLRMPERVGMITNKLFPSLDELNKSIKLEIHNKKLHLKVLDQMSKTLKKIEERFK